MDSAMEKIRVVCRSSDSRHTVASAEAMAGRLSRLTGRPLAPTSESFEEADRTFFVPTFSLIRKDNHPDLHHSGFFGGLVDHEFMTTKLVTHPVWEDEDNLPAGWNAEFAEELRDCVLPGFSVFSHRHAMHAGASLLKSRKVRFKNPYAAGGKEQSVCETHREIEDYLQTLTPRSMASGVVIEEDIENSTTYCVGQIRVAGTVASYLGRQYTSRNPGDEPVYAGSRLHVVRGGWDDLLERLRTPVARWIIEGAIRYDEAAERHLGLVASRKNYDVLVGPITEGGFCRGVLEQSWRIGGASPAEILALERLAENSSVYALQVVAREGYGQTPQFRDDDFIVYVGEDDGGRPFHKYARIEKIYHDP